MEVKEYHLVTLADLLTIPPDDRAACLRELEYCLLFVELAFGEQAHAVFKGMDWTNDGDKSVSMTLGDETLKLEIKRGDLPESKE